MSHEIYGIQTPSDIVALVPTDLQYVYERISDGDDVLGVTFSTEGLGSFVVWLSTSAARHVVSHLTAMLDDLDHLRGEYAKRNPQKGNTDGQ